MTELEHALLDLGRTLELPATPDIAASVSRRLAAAETVRPRRLGRRRLVLVFAALVIAVGAAFAVPPARTAILEWLGLRGATVERVFALPDVPAERGFDVDQLGERMSLAEASERAGFAVAVPSVLGVPDLVYLDESAPGGRVSLVYLPNTKTPTVTGVGLLLTEFSGELSPELLGKVVAGGTDVEQVALGGAPGLWISGEPHVVFYRDPQHEVREDTARLAGNVLLVERGDLLVRIEAEISKEEALEIAASLKPRS